MNTGDSRELSVGGRAPSVESFDRLASELGPKNSNFPSAEHANERESASESDKPRVLDLDDLVANHRVEVEPGNVVRFVRREQGIPSEHTSAVSADVGPVHEGILDSASESTHREAERAREVQCDGESAAWIAFRLRREQMRQEANTAAMRWAVRKFFASELERVPTWDGGTLLRRVGA